MWAALPLRLYPPTIPTTTGRRSPQQRCLVFAVQSLKTDKESSQYNGGDSVGQAILTAINSNKPPEKTSSKSRPKEKKQQNQEPKQEQQKPLSGADVLWALQRATAQKSKKKKDKREALSRDGKLAAKEIKGTVDYSSVRPLCIKNEWSAQLEELERQLQELMSLED